MVEWLKSYDEKGVIKMQSCACSLCLTCCWFVVIIKINLSVSPVGTKEEADNASQMKLQEKGRQCDVQGCNLGGEEEDTMREM